MRREISMIQVNARQWSTVLRGATLFALLLGLILGGAGNVYAAHESNNRAALSGAGGVSGTAHVNYVKGTEGWSSTVSVFGLATGNYVFAVRLNAGAFQTVCAFSADGVGSDGCSDQDSVLGGFNQAVIVADTNGNGLADAGEMVVASGTFARRGGCREPDQAGVDCPNEKH